MEKEKFWGEPDGLIHFCEDKYVYNKYIYEFWNSISNISYIITGYTIKNFKIMSSLIILIGIGSFIFHGTGRFYGELIDEIPMDIFVLTAYCHLPTSRLKNKISMVLSHSLGIFIYIIYMNFLLFYLLFLSGIIITFIDLYKLSRNDYKAFNSLSKFLFFFIPAKILWIIEQTICHKYPDLYFFHSLWHILSAISLFYACDTIKVINKKNN